jgi:NAD(P)H-flavin reductase
VETADTVSLELVPAGDRGMAYAPGEFNMMYVQGVGEVPLSIAGGQDGALVHTIRNVGAVTSAICDLDRDDLVGIRGPYGTGWPLGPATGKDVLVVAGGIGLAPLRPAILHLLEHRELFGAVSIVYGARAPSELLFEADLHEWRSRFDTEVEVTVDLAPESWRGDVGVVTPLVSRAEFDRSNVVAMLCGPEVMMRVVGRTLISQGVAADDISVSLERNMKCAVGFCGRCQFGPDFLCKDGPVVSYARVADRMGMTEL